MNRKIKDDRNRKLYQQELSADQTTENGANKTAGVSTSHQNTAASATDPGTKVSSPSLFSFSL